MDNRILWALVAQCRGCLCAFDNRAVDGKQEAQVQGLLALVQDHAGVP